VLKKETTFKN